ncbi:MAG: LysE family translocator [Opitutaceae bacterium]
MAGQLALLLGVLTLGLLSPGPDFFIVVRNSIGRTRIQGLATVAGIVAGLGVHTSLIAFGIGTLSEEIMRGVSAAGACFLAWLGIRALTAASFETAADDRPAASPRLARAGFVEGLLCNLTNPKAFFFFVSVFAQLMPAGMRSGWRMALPVIVVVHGAILWSLILLALQSPPVARRLARMQRWLPRCFGAALLLFAALVAIDLARDWPVF